MKLDDHDRAWADRLRAMTPEQLRTYKGSSTDFTGRGDMFAYILTKAREDAVKQVVANRMTEIVQIYREAVCPEPKRMVFQAMDDVLQIALELGGWPWGKKSS